MKGNRGFIFLEFIAAILMISLVLCGTFAAANGGVALMLRHNKQQEAWELAQQEMRQLIGKPATVDEMRIEGDYTIISSKTAVSDCPFSQLSVEVYFGSESHPLVNLVGYE